jgi:hypothetical protein
VENYKACNPGILNVPQFQRDEIYKAALCREMRWEVKAKDLAKNERKMKLPG